MLFMKYTGFNYLENEFSFIVHYLNHNKDSFPIQLIYDGKVTITTDVVAEYKIEEFVKTCSCEELVRDFLLVSGKFSVLFSKFFDMKFLSESLIKEILSINKYAFINDKRLLPYVDEKIIFEAKLLDIYEEEEND